MRSLSELYHQEIHFFDLLSGFSLGRLHMGGTSAGGQSVNEGGLMKGDIDLMGGT